MATISISTPSDGQTIDAADVNSPLNTIVAAINGNLDDDNIKSGANINGTKLLANSAPLSALDANGRGGWITGVLPAPNTVTANGNRNYSLVFNTTDLTSYISNGMRLKATRTVTAPTQCTSLTAASSQYYSKTSPAGMTFTDDFTVSAWVKLSSYAAGTIASRYNGTSGWCFEVLATGQLQMVGYNAGSANPSYNISAQSLPLNKWVHVAGQLDMSTFTNTTTTSYFMVDGVDVSATVGRSGTNPTALVQAGNLEIGGQNGGTRPFNGKIAQVAIYNAKVAQATILASMHQTLSGSETSLISAYSFNNSINDLSSNANNLTAQASAVATNVDSPFAGGANASTAYTAGTAEFGEVFDVTFSTNTTVVVQVPDGYALPTSGGISALAYSTAAQPLGWMLAGGIKELAFIINGAGFTSGTTGNGIAIPGFDVTPYIPKNRKVRITLYDYAVSTSTTNSGAIKFWNAAVGTTELGETQVGAFTGATTNSVTALFEGYVGTAGSNRLTASLAVSAGTATINSFPGSTAFAWFKVELT